MRSADFVPWERSLPGDLAVSMGYPRFHLVDGRLSPRRIATCQAYFQAAEVLFAWQIALLEAAARDVPEEVRHPGLLLFHLCQECRPLVFTSKRAAGEPAFCPIRHLFRCLHRRVETLSNSRAW